jgi:hypothetical protein
VVPSVANSILSTNGVQNSIFESCDAYLSIIFSTTLSSI